MGWKPLPISMDNFEKIIHGNYYFVDKTLFIKELLDMKGEVILFLRPRRFGNTVNMSMLQYFFEKGEKDNTALFRGLDIMDAGEEYLAHMGKYPVISISLKSMKQCSYEQAFRMLQKIVAEEYSRHWRDVEKSGKLSEENLERYQRICEMKGVEADYADSLKFLSECLYICVGRKAVILIDEYDVPLENAYFSGFYDRMSMLLRSLFESALKTNDNLKFAVMTGCLRGSKESVFSGFNNQKVMSVADNAYEKWFGFTLEEVTQMLREYRLEENLKTMQEWYGGYCFGDTEIYNPWSVIYYMEDCLKNKSATAKTYWSNAGSDTILRRLMEMRGLSVKQEIEALIEGGTIEKPIHEDITYDDMDSTEDNLWNFLFFTGYLKKISERQEGEMIYMEMAIPNSEVRYVYKNAVLRWFEEKTKKKELTPLYESMLNGDTEKMAEILSENLMETISFYDYQESYYHGFLAGMLRNIGNYIVQSNRESGNGRPDILVKYPSVRGKAVIIEIKVSKTYRGLADKCDEALAQIEAQRYEEALRQEGYQDIIKYGVAFYRKECMVKCAPGCQTGR